ncbi:MAG: hypothetical protein V3U44_05010, partial [Alphaproteobacteria bacterium]
MRCAAALAFAAVTLATPAAADWPTTSFVPVPPGDDVQDIVGSGFSDYASDGGTLVVRGNQLVIELPDLDLGALRRGAPAALIDVMRVVSIDARKMAAAGFATPRIEPLLSVGGGDAYYPIFWRAPVSGYTFQAGGPCGPRISDAAMVYILANGTAFPYSRLDSAWRTGGRNREEMIAFVGSQLVHEVVHTVQQNAFLANCGDAPPWLKEGPADGVAFFLSAKRIADAFDKFTWMRNERRYDVSLDVRQFSGEDATRYGYATGSFFRYLIEASRGGGVHDLAIMKNVVAMAATTVESRNGIVAELDRIIGAHSGGR